MQQPIGFTWQEYLDGACGKYALQHALLLLGIPVTRKDTNKATGVPPVITRLFGTNPEQLKRGLKYFGCKGIDGYLDSPDRLREKLDGFLARGCPAILAVEDDEHWIVIAGKRSANEYYWIDSADEDLIGCWNWKDIVEWIGSETYYLIGVVPRNKGLREHSLVARFSQIVRLLDDEDLREYWGYYLEDLHEMFDCPVLYGVPAREFFRQYGAMVYQASCYYYLHSDEKKMLWELENYRKVAIAHCLTVSTEEIPKAIAHLSAALTCIACVEQ